MSERQPTGLRIRQRRTERGLRQAELAQAVGISPSYLNLIEHGRRRIGGRLLGDLARALDLDAAALAEAPDVLRLQALRQASDGAPEGLRPPPEAERAQDFADRFPGWAALVAAQARRIEGLEGRLAALAQRLSHDRALAQALHQVLTGVTAIQSAAGILTEEAGLDADWQARFLANIRADSAALAQASRALAQAMEAPAEVPRLSPREEAERWLDLRDHHLPEVEAGGLPADLPDGAAGEVLRAWIARYGADAAALPLGPFEAAAREESHDAARLARRFAAPLPCVLRRLAALPAGHPRFGLVIADASGSLRHLKALDGVPFPREGGCPLWPLHEAWAQPGRGLRAVAALPGPGAPRLLCHAVAAPAEEPDWDRPPWMEATMLMAPAPPEPAANDRLVGPSCRLCLREGCSARREPSILR